MLKYLSKFTMDILPSVAATIIGAYIVNHYIANKPAAEAPVAAALSAASPKAIAKALEGPSDVANLPEAGVRAKGISEKAVFEKSSIERAAVEKKVTEKPVIEKPAEKSAEKPQEKSEETASIPAETRRHSPAPREKTAIRTIPLTTPAVVASAPAAPSAPAPAAAAPTPPTLEAAVAPDEHHDANDLARAAIERLRGANDGAPHGPEVARTPDAPHVASAPPVSAPPVSVQSVRPLPPPIMVSTPPAETFGAPTGPSQPPQQAYDPRRPTPPADIPGPLDLRAEAGEPSPQPPVVREHRNVADDMLSAAKSVFHAVLPQ